MASLYISYFASIGDVTRGLAAGVVGIGPSDVIEILPENSVATSPWPAGCAYAQCFSDGGCYVAVGSAPDATDLSATFSVGTSPVLIGRPRIDGDVYFATCARPIEESPGPGDE